MRECGNISGKESLLCPPFLFFFLINKLVLLLTCLVAVLSEEGFRNYYLECFYPAATGTIIIV